MKIKKYIPILFAFVMAFVLVACTDSSNSTASNENTSSSQNAAEQSTESSKAANENIASSEAPNANSENTIPNSNHEPEGSKILVAYFSVTNNTEGVAQKLADGLSADLYEITPEQPYTEEDLDYGNSKSRSSVEMNDSNARPAISGSVDNMDAYDVVFIGYPIWWGEAPRIMSTFVESYDFSGKTLVAFCTSASSGFGSSDSALKSATDKATWLDGHRFSAGADSDEVMEWANGLDIH